MDHSFYLCWLRLSQDGWEKHSSFSTPKTFKRHNLALWLKSAFWAKNVNVMASLTALLTSQVPRTPCQLLNSVMGVGKIGSCMVESNAWYSEAHKFSPPAFPATGFHMKVMWRNSTALGRLVVCQEPVWDSGQETESCKAEELWFESHLCSGLTRWS